jgi:hypothetical protein
MAATARGKWQSRWLNLIRLFGYITVIDFTPLF